MPRVTVVTICFNAQNLIRPTMESVLGQDYPNLEYLVVDGGSRDSTPQIISEYSNRLAWWVSEKDSGVSEAFNKGIARSTGDFIGFMNAGDFFYSPTALSDLFRNYPQQSTADIFYGKAKLTFEQAPEKIVGGTARPRYKLPTAHQAMYYHRRVWERFGTFSLNYRYAMDYEHYLRLRSNVEYAFSNSIIALRPLTSARNSFGNPSRTYREYLRADREHRNPALMLNLAKYLRDRIKERF